MARQVIDTKPPIGDPAPTAFNKVNAMTSELYDSVGTLTTRATTLETNVGTLTTTKVSKGANGTWPDTIPSAYNLWENPRVIQAFGSGVANTPTTFGIAISWANMAPDTSGNFTKGSGRWINQIVFGTNNDVYFGQSINGNQFGTWRQFWHSGNTTVDANNFIKRA